MFTKLSNSWALVKYKRAYKKSAPPSTPDEKPAD
jgi:hypothetical protein